MGRTASKGAGGIAALLQRIESSDAAIPPALLQALAPLARQWRAADAEVAALAKQRLALVRENPAARRLMTIPGVGPLTAHAAVAAIGAGRQFSTARDSAAWLGMPRFQHDPGRQGQLTGRIRRLGALERETCRERTGKEGL